MARKYTQQEIDDKMNLDEHVKRKMDNDSQYLGFVDDELQNYMRDPNEIERTTNELVATRRKQLESYIGESQKRKYEEQGYGKLLNRVLDHYVNEGLPISKKTFSKTPMQVMRWQEPDDIWNSERKRAFNWRNHMRSDLEKYKPGAPISDSIIHYARINGVTPEQQQKAFFDRRIQQLADADEELANIEGGMNSYASEREGVAVNKKLGENLFFKKDGTPKEAAKRLYKLLRGNASIDKDGDLISRTDEHIFSPTQSHYSDIIKAAKEGLIQYDKRTNTYVIPKHIVRRIDPYYKDYNTTVNAILGDYGRGELGIRNRWENTRFKNRFGYAMSLRGVKNLAKTTNKEQALAYVRELLDDHYTSFIDPNEYRDRNANGNDERNVERLPKELNSLNEARTYRETAERVKQDAERRQMIAQYRREYGFDATDMSDEEINQRLAMPFNYSNDIVKLVHTAYSKDKDGNALDSWILPQTADELKARGNQMHHCVGTYSGRVRDHKCLILFKGDETAEIQLTLGRDTGLAEDDPNYYKVIATEINQVKGPYNEVREPDKELKWIASRLKGCYVEHDDHDEDLENKIIEAYARGGYVANAEENKLLKAAEGYKGTDNVEGQIRAEAEADGISDEWIIQKVMQRLKKTESGKNGGAFGTPHKATDRYRAIKNAMQGMVI